LKIFFKKYKAIYVIKLPLKLINIDVFDINCQCKMCALTVDLSLLHVLL